MNTFKSTPILNQRSCAHAQFGFTLLELLTVVAIVGVLASIAIGQYNQHIIQSNRRAAVASLYAAQQIMERTRLQTGEYQLLNAAQLANLSTQGQTYTLASSLENNGYTLTATPPANQPDTECGVLSITQSDKREVTGSASVTECWQ
ncbi:MAG: prepilin-type N-terminal cleavage/methylation domain-containing protein [Burkholderiales bacterium]|nr:prepilin-type N-terminal cleavage/methylation domain-containing protein [Burkholderiales bacterium]